MERPSPTSPAPAAARPAASSAAALPESQGRGALRLVIFFTVLTGCLYAADYVVNRGLRKVQTSAFGVSNRIMTGQVNADIVISGSSRAFTHYDPRIIQEVTGHSAFNIGRNGSQTDMQVAFLKAYLAHNAKPKLVVHNLDLFSFVTSREIYDPAQYLPYLREPSIYAGVKRVYPDAWKWKYLPLYGYVVHDMRFTWLQGLKGFLGMNPPEDHFAGYLPRHTPWTGEFERFRAAHPDGVKFDIETRGVEDLTEIATLCHEQGIPLLFVYSPVYIEMQALERNREEIFVRFREIAARFNVTLWDYSKSDVSRDQVNFYNSQHLNSGGAEAFTRAVANDLKNSLLPRLQNSSGRSIQ